MKKWTVMVSAIILVMVISACGNNVKDGESGATIKPTDNKVESKGVPTVEELIKKTTEASQGFKSYSMDIKMDQNMSIDANGTKQDQKVNMEIKTDMIKEPLAMYQEIKTNVPGLPEAQEIKQYITQEGIYTQTQGTWMKLPDETKDQLMASINAQGSPEKQLEQFNSITKDTKVTEDGDNYVMSAEVSGDSVKELAKKLMSGSGSPNPQLEAMMGSMNITHMKLTYVINKKEYLPVSMNVEMNMDMDQEGQKIGMEMKMDSSFSNYNEVKEIKVPQEALDSAK
ncbi:DUF6612 family protein [Paenibacillus eucommiae]|uniref:LppX_LprAFG lipoprotein n=1 Tax=Paenibacillus eucommiae TaxID=1355755 RepID=A0ABS4IW26_9BACL|nr:DUF6612 family protein [Paenibacillus eucommiae]MBP1991793.1 hypothetical protein [Paenibacillus eucommiae]